MDITLVTASNSKEVHGTDNDKKTGCGINLLRGENVTVYRRIGRMTDLKEITCEKCKASLAKKMIKADKKEMSRLLKEEKQRAKMGMDDEGIVPLGNTTAKITRSPEQIRQDEQRARYGLPPAGTNQPAPQAPPVQNTQPVQPQPEPSKTIPGTGVAIDNSLAAFAINKPGAAPEEPKQDDFASQFAFQKPAAEEKPAVQDDFLAQFAVPSANAPAQPAPQPMMQQPVQPAPQPMQQPAQSPVIDNVDDILSMFSVENVASQGVPVSPAFSNNNQNSADNGFSAAPAPQPAQGMGNVNQWDSVADQIFGGVPQPAPQQSAPAAPPVLDDISVPQPSAPYGMNSAPVFEDIAPVQSAPVLDDIAAPVQNAAPVFEDITAEIPSVANDKPEVLGLDDLFEVPEVPAAPSAPAPKVDLFKEEIEDIGIPEPQQTMEQPAPVQPQAAPAQQAVSEQPQIISVPQLAGYDQNGQPIYNYIQMQMTGLDPNGQPIFAPISGQPAPAPVQQPAQAFRPQQPVQARPVVPRRPVANTGAPKANVSKIAVHPHAKQTSQAFINAIASSKEYADKNLIDTQGLRANTPILSSVEDVLSTMGDDSAKQRLLAAQAEAQKEKTVTAFSEYKGPTAQPNRRPVPPQFRNTPSQQQRDPRAMTKSELKAYKKQEKIEAKFKKEMAKRGGY